MMRELAPADFSQVPRGPPDCFGNSAGVRVTPHSPPNLPRADFSEMQMRRKPGCAGRTGMVPLDSVVQISLFEKAVEPRVRARLTGLPRGPDAIRPIYFRFKFQSRDRQPLRPICRAGKCTGR